MHEDEWGHFIDLEMNQNQNQIEIENQIQKQIEKKIKSQPKKTQEVKMSKNLTVIYEEDIWYRRDETDVCDYYIKEGLSELVPYHIYLKEEPRKEKPKKEEPRKEELKKETAGFINKIATLLYCIICTTFISCSLFLI